MKKFYLLLLALIASAAAWAADPVLSLSGTGTASDPYLITSASDLVALETACNAATTSERGHYKNVYFKQTADIDMSSVTDFIGIANAPSPLSGSTTWYFSGIYDGDGHKITNLTIADVVVDESTGKPASWGSGEGKSRRYAGLFGYVTGATIKNLTLDASCTVEGYQYVGGFAGYAAKSTFSNLVNKATVKAWYDYAGGIIGYVNAASSTTVTIENCLNTGAITAHSGYVGGIAGYAKYTTATGVANQGAISASHLYDATTTSIDAGGIFGQAYQGVKLTNAINYGTITATSREGGIAGNSSGGSTATSKNEYTAVVNVGMTETEDLVYVGSLFGQVSTTETYNSYSNAYYDNQITGPNAIQAKGASDYEGITAALTRELTSGTALTGFDTKVWTFTAGKYPMLTGLTDDNTAIMAGTYFTLPDDEVASDFKTSATLADGVTATMKVGTAFTVADGKITSNTVKDVVNDVAILTNGTYTKSVPVTKMPTLWSGSGTATDPYLIQTKTDLENLAKMVNVQAKHYEGAYFKQTADIDMESDTTFHGIGCVHTGGSSYNSYYFAGTYDGGGFTVKNLNIENVSYGTDGAVILANSDEGKTMDNVGLFGATNGATIKNVTITGKVAGFQYVGGIVGYAVAGTTIENCVNNAAVTAYYGDGGGIAGRNADGNVIVRCRNKGVVVSNSFDAAGIAGENDGTIENCQNDGTVSAKFVVSVTNNVDIVAGKAYRAGGIAGYASATGVIKNVVNTAAVTADGKSASGIIAYNRGKVTAALNLGVVSSPDASMTSAIVSENIASDDQFASNYYDSQLSGISGVGNNDETGVTGTETAVLTSGNAVAGLGDSVWTFTAGYYPMLTAFSDAYSKSAAGTYMTLPTGEKAKNFKTTGTLSTGTTGTLATGTVFKVADGKVTASTVTETATDVLTLTNGDYTTTVDLQKLAKILDGNGTADDPYLIKKADDYLAVANQLISTKFNYEGEYFKIVNNLDFSGKTFVPLGNYDVPFAGTLDGGSKTISNVDLEAEGTDEDANAGLYYALVGYTTAKSTIKNVKLNNSTFSGFAHVAGIVAYTAGTVDNCEVGEDVVLTDTSSVTVSSLSTSRNGRYLGGIVGEAAGSAQISNCVSRATLNGYISLGGIAGAASEDNVKISASKNYGTVKSLAPDKVASMSSVVVTPVDVKAGGIVGEAVGTIENCQNYGAVSIIGRYVGGIAGQLGLSSATSVITGCSNYGTIYAEHSCAAGVAGRTYTSSGTCTIKDSHNYGNVTADLMGYVAGITSQLSKNVTISYCSNEGNITFNCYSRVFTSGSRHTTVYSNSSYAAGIVSYGNGLAAIDHCWNGGTIYGKGSYVAGIMGTAGTYYTTIDNCFNVGTINADSAAATFDAGILTLGKAVVNNCYNAGTIIGPKYIAGVYANPTTGTSSSPGATAKKTYNVGDVTVTTTDVDDYMGNCFGNSRNGYVTTENNYFLASKAMGNCDAVFGAVGMTPAQLFAASDSLGDQYVYNAYTFPMLAGMDTIAAAKAYAAYFQLADGDTPDSVTTAFSLSKIDGVTWTATGGLTIVGSYARPTAVGEATLTATAGNYSKTYKFNVSKVRLVGDINNDGQVNVTDVTMLANRVLNAVDLSDAICDLNGDGRIDVTDITIIVNIMLNKN